MFLLLYIHNTQYTTHTVTANIGSIVDISIKNKCTGPFSINEKKAGYLGIYIPDK